METTSSKKDHTPALLRFVRWFFPKLERFAPALAHRYFLKIFFSPLRYDAPEKEKKAAHYAEKFSLIVDSKKIQGYRWGKGDRYVLCIHGWAGRGTQFRRFIKPLTQAGYRIVAFDGPAHGASQGKKTNLMEFEAVLRRLIAQEGTPQCIIAHSFGGSAALYAIMNGLPVNRLINVGTPTIGDEIIRTYLRAINGSWNTGLFFKEYMVKTFGKSFDEFTAMYFVKHLPQPLELLLVHDEDDHEVIIRHPEELIKKFPSAKLIRTSGLGHTRILKDDSVIRACVTFVEHGTSGLR